MAGVKKPVKSTAKLHSPSELLNNAYLLLATENPKFMRSAILESMSALEAFVQNTVFPLLEQKLDPRKMD